MSSCLEIDLKGSGLTLRALEMILEVLNGRGEIKIVNYGGEQTLLDLGLLVLVQYEKAKAQVNGNG
jgi:hypothetical protein